MLDDAPRFNLAGTKLVKLPCVNLKEGYCHQCFFDGEYGCNAKEKLGIEIWSEFHCRETVKVDGRFVTQDYVYVIDDPAALESYIVAVVTAKLED